MGILVGDMRMRSLFSKIEKKDITFLGVLALFTLVVVFRFFDRGLVYHAARFSIMQNYNFSMLVITGYFFTLFLVYFLCLNKVQTENKKNIYYLIMFSAVFSLPMFLNINYFGTMDVYVWILVLIQMLFLIIGKVEWLSVPLVFLITYISPLSFFYCETIVLFLFLNKYYKQKNRRYLVLFCINSLIGLIVFFVAKYQENLLIDAQMNLTLKQFLLMILCFSPYLYLAFVFLKKLKMKWFMIIGVLPSVVINLYLQDFSRAVFYVFAYFIFVVLCLVVLEDENTISQLEATKTKVKEWIPLPILVIVYPLLFMTFWVAGPLALMNENF